jgi:hypothetical protein
VKVENLEVRESSHKRDKARLHKATSIYLIPTPQQLKHILLQQQYTRGPEAGTNFEGFMRAAGWHPCSVGVGSVVDIIARAFECC